jgi:hypothetical protein
MCRRVTCPKCNKPTYSGCGAHNEQVLGDVPKPQRCQCREAAAASSVQPSPQKESKRWWKL